MLRVAILVLVVGLLALAVNAVHNARIPMRPLALEVPLDRSGHEASGELTSAIDGRYELELVFGPGSTKQQHRELALARSSPVDLVWSVHDAQGELIGTGDCREFLYLEVWQPAARRIWSRLFFRETESIRHSPIRRGVGAFRARSGERYVVTARVGEAFEDADTRLVVRVERPFWNRHVARTAPLAWLGVLALGAGAPVVGLLLAGRLVGRWRSG